MKYFLKVVILFFILIFVLCSSVLLISNRIIEKSVAINDHVSVLIVGDSHAQNGINLDGRIPKSLNLASSGETYYFCYNKIKYFVDKGIKIDKVVLSLGPHNLSTSIDSLWVFDKSAFIEKTAGYWPLMEKMSILPLIRMSGFSFFTLIELVPEILYKAFYSLERTILLRKDPFIGGFTPNDGNIKLDSIINTGVNSTEIGKQSEIQLHYLNKTIDLCNHNGINIILLNTPLYYGTELGPIPEINSKCEILDYGSMFKMNKEYFADYVHLNPHGAKIFSDTLIKTLNLK